MSIDDKEFNQVAQLSHAGWGALVVVVAALFGPPKVVIAVAVLASCVAAWKEFYWDQHYETAEVRGSNLVDFMFYALGISVGMVLAAVHWRMM